MRSVFAQLAAWLAEGHDGVLVRLVDTVGSAPRELGATMLVGSDGAIIGSVSGGCVESAVVQRARSLLERSAPESVLEDFGTGSDPDFDPGLSCGGTMRLLLQTIQPADREPLRRFFSSCRDGRPAVLATRFVAGAASPLLVVTEGDAAGSLGRVELDAAVSSSVPALVSGHGPAVQTHRMAAGPVGADVIVHVHLRRSEVVVVGADDVAVALTEIARRTGRRVVVVDPRAAFAVPERFPDADLVVAEWPDRYIRSAGRDLGPNDAVCVLTHDQRVDVPAIMAALATEVGYLGAMGSRSTHADRLVRLQLAGMTEADAQRLHSPIGLDIGAVTPEETALAVMAEIVAARSGRSGAPLRDTAGPIRSRRGALECAGT